MSFFESGEVRISLNGDLREDIRAFLLRLGFEFEFLNSGINEFPYYGMGEHENYWDMHHHARAGMHKSTAEREYVPYVAFKYVSKPIMNLLYLNIQKKLTEAMHTDELYKKGYVNVRIDYKVSGIGSGSCGPQISDKYRLTDKKIAFQFYIK